MVRLLLVLFACASGAQLRLCAAGVPTITTHPVPETVVAGDSVVLRVAATGDGPLEYYWFRDTILATINSTSPVLTLTNVQPHHAGSYTVVVRNPAGSITSQAAKLTVTPRPMVGAYFGNMQGSSDTFALYLRADGTGVFLAHQRVRGPSGVFLARNVRVGSDRRFQFAAKSVSGLQVGSEVEAKVEIEADGSILGAFGDRALVAPPGTVTGPTSASTGFYAAAADTISTPPGPNERASNLSYMIVGPNGTGYAIFAGATLSEGGRVAIDGNGDFSGRTDNNLLLQGTVQATTRLLTITLSQASFPALRFVGADTGRAVVEALVNLSTRGPITTANASFTAGFVVTGTQPKTVLVRGVGPALAAFGVSNALAAPRLEIFRGSTSIAVGTDWSAAIDAATVVATTDRVGGFPLAVGSRDAALLLVLEPGAYSASLSGQAGAIGTGLVEVYDATRGNVPRDEHMANISTLGVAGTGDDVLTAGFNIRGTVAKRVLVRAAGPGLAAFGVRNAVGRSRLAVYAGSTVVAENIGWSNSSEAAAAAAAANEVAAFPFMAGSTDCALVLNLAPGSYTAQVSSLGAASGTALVEIYALP